MSTPHRTTMPSSVSHHLTTARNQIVNIMQKTQRALHSRLNDGYRKGMQGNNNSCYLDSTLMALFYSTNAFDDIFRLQQETFSSDTIQNDVHLHLKVIVDLLRSPDNYCPHFVAQKLRNDLAKLNPKLNGQMMDVEELFSTLCGKALHLPHFIYYNGVDRSHYYHQLILEPNPVEKWGRLQLLLSQSLTKQILEIRLLPTPAFLVKMPRSNGHLVGYDAIIPGLTLQIPGLTGDTLELHAVICLRHCHYTCFIRSNKHWVYFDSMAAGGEPEVKKLDFMENLLVKIQNQNINLKSSDIEERWLFKLITDIHFCVYLRQDACHQPTPAVPLSAPQQSSSRPWNPSAPFLTRPSQTHMDGRMIRVHSYSTTTSSYIAIGGTPYRQNLPNVINANAISAARCPPISPAVYPVSIAPNKNHSPGTNKVKAFFEKMLTTVKTFVQYPFLTHDLNNSMHLLGNKRRLAPEEFFCYERLGATKGIERSMNSSISSCIEAPLFCFLSNTRVNDNLFFAGISSNDPMRRQISQLLSKVADCLRYSPYLCGRNYIEELRLLLATVNPVLRENVLDMTEMLFLLFGQVLKLQHFVQYTSKTSTYIHQIVLAAENIDAKVITVEAAFIQSMNFQRLRLDSIPNPQLIINFPRSRDQLRIRYVIPSLRIHLQSVLKNMLPLDMELFAIICWSPDNHYVGYAKYNADQDCEQSCWIKTKYSADNQPSVVPWPSLHKFLEEANGCSRLQKRKDRDYVEFIRFCEQVQVCVYKSKELFYQQTMNFRVLMK